MRRYGVRILVAVLTFGIGVALSLVFGLFRAQDIKVGERWSRSSSCRQRLRVVRPAFVTVDNQPNEPLQVVYWGALDATPHSPQGSGRGLRFLVENRSNKAITGYLISGKKIWEANEPSGDFVLQSESNVVLMPGESQSVTVSYNTARELSLRVLRVDFPDGSSWNNPREESR